MNKSLLAEYAKNLLTEQQTTPAQNKTPEPETLSQTPLADRLKRLTASIPESERSTPRSLEFFRSRLRGIGGRGAHPGQTGEALRKLGWTRKRCWAKDGTFSALWHPPVEVK